MNVDGSGPTINTTDASVSTVIDRKFVENTPLNGRSFQSLILLTAGAITNTPQRTAQSGLNGEFTINGQRTESNSYLVDGVSANSGTSPTVTGAGSTGSLPSSTALGTTQSLVSVDALQEFRVESSTYSAEYGRAPGGQFSMVTRSGTNDWHGTAFDYFRNDALDANSWFNDHTTPITRKSPERQNDFGGAFGGPIRIPWLYNGHDRTFFFFSYEGLRLLLPQAVTINAVPNLTLRNDPAITGSLKQVLNAFPLPTTGAPDLGNGLGEFIAGWSNPSQVDATSIRFDHSLGQRTHLFFRFSNTPSSASTRGTSAAYSTPSNFSSLVDGARTYTFGTTTHLARTTDNDFRLNFSRSEYRSQSTNDNFGGAVPVDLRAIQGVSSSGSVSVGLQLGAYEPILGVGRSGGHTSQWNLVDTVSTTHGKHTIKMGADWRRTASVLQQYTPNTSYYFLSVAHLETNTVDQGTGQSLAPVYPVYNNFALFVQDEWRVHSRFNLSAGIRWDVSPAAGVSQGSLPYTVTQITNLPTMTLAPRGTSLWQTSWYNIAPRLGAAYILNPAPEHLTVLRAGGGVFFDTGQQTGNAAFSNPGFSAINYFGSSYGVAASFPVPLTTAAPTVNPVPVAPYSSITVFPKHFQAPYTYQWNASLEQALGKSQSLTISYVGANGRKLIQDSYSNVSASNPNFRYLFVYKNGLTSSYNALQLQYRRQVAKGLQAIASYTWSHMLDYGSFNGAQPYRRGNSDYDVRHNATAAVSYDLPHSDQSAWLRAISSDWGIDGRFTVRTGFPITLLGNSFVDPAVGATVYGGLNIVPNAPLFQYASKSLYPGGRRINPTAFTTPASGTYGNAPRNFITGFGAVQTDVAIRRSFPIHDALHGQFRIEAFNVFNHPNFGSINTAFGGVQFGQATAILSQSLGTLSPLYQTGGPRSLQAMLRLTF